MCNSNKNNEKKKIYISKYSTKCYFKMKNCYYKNLNKIFIIKFCTIDKIK